MTYIRQDNDHVYLNLWDKTLEYDRIEYALYQLSSEFEQRIVTDIQAIVDYRLNGVAHKISIIDGKTVNEICPYCEKSLDYMRKAINTTTECANKILTQYKIELNPNWQEINKKWLAEIDRFSKIFYSTIGKATQAALDHQVYKYNQAFQEELSKDFGLSFSVLSSSVIDHLVYAAQSAKKEQKDYARAERVATEAIKGSSADITAQILNAICPVYIDSFEPAMKDLMNQYYSYILSIFSNELHHPIEEVLKKFDFERSNNLLLSVSDNARENILMALQIYPNNGNVIGYAIQNDVLDPELCQYERNVHRNFVILLKKWSISTLRNIYESGKLFNKPLVTNENKAIIDGLKRFYKIQCPNLRKCEDWQDIVTESFAEDVAKHLTDIAEIAVAQTSILVPEKFDELAKSGKRFYLSHDAKALFVCLYHDLVFDGAYTSASFLDLTAPFSENDIGEKISELNEKLNTRSSTLIKQEAERRRAEAQRRELERQAEIKRQEEKRQEKELFKRKVKKNILIVTPIISVVLIFFMILSNVIVPNSKYNAAIKLMEEGDYEQAICIFESVNNYKDSKEKIQICKMTIAELKYQSELKSMEQKYQTALSLIDDGKLNQAISLLMTIPDYRDSFTLILELAENFQKYILATGSQTHVLTHNGDALSIGVHTKDLSFNDTNNIIKFSLGAWYKVGLRFNKTVVAVGSNSCGQCDVDDWYDIVDIATGFEHTVGLKLDGTVVAIGKNDAGQCNVQDWKNVIQIVAEGNYTIGLTSDGEVLFTGYNDLYSSIDISSWSQITKVYTVYGSVIGLKSDGTVIATGTNGFGKLDISFWNEVISISMGSNHTVGLKSDGSVLSTGQNNQGQCNTQNWGKIVSVCAGYAHTVGLKSDGTVVSTGSNDNGQCNVEDWTDIIAISAGDSHTIGLKSDGTVVATGSNDSGQCDVYGWNLFD